MSIISLGVAFLLLLFIGGIWFLLYYFGNPVIEDPDGIAKVVGNCGDTMEIGLKINKDKVSATHYWSNGCSFSKRCVEAAATLCQNRSLDEIKKINMISIMDVVGELPETHLHCAQLAEITLQKSLEDYLSKSRFPKNSRIN
jgi:nitrogen fixation protein NifU and related proteins